MLGSNITNNYTGCARPNGGSFLLSPASAYPGFLRGVDKAAMSTYNMPNLERKAKMRILCLSDTHGMHNQVQMPHNRPDVVIHAGDCTSYGRLEDLDSFLRWYSKSFPHSEKILVAGNHDGVFESESRGMARYMCLEAGVIYLENSHAVIKDTLFYGSPYTPNFNNWHFMRDRGGPELAYNWSMVPDDVDVLITHGPPLGMLDYTTNGGRNVGCELLADRLDKLERLKLHVFGHVHGSYGLHTSEGGVRYINAALADERYTINRRPIEVEIEI